MTTELVAVQLADGSQLMVEVDQPPPPVGVEAVGLGDGKIDLGAALEQIKSAAIEVQDKLRSIAVPPESFELSFGIKLSASAGVILAKAGTEANFTVKMNWSKK
jgi:Trypsin-co-occurring domain 1